MDRLRSEKFLWKDFRTGVQLPSPPPKSKVANFDVLIAKNVFALVYHTAVYGR